MILISYPSGGFGNFLYHTLTEFSSNTYKPHNTNFEFDSLGRSHDTIKYTNVYFHDPESYEIVLPVTDKECLILCDNGINNDSYEKINVTFPDAIKIRLVIDSAARPVIYKTCLIKAKVVDHIQNSLEHIFNNWGDVHDYSIRENFTLLYHNWPFKWGVDPDCINVELSSLISNPAQTITKLIEEIGGEVISSESLYDLCADWTFHNKDYCSIYFDWATIESALDTNTCVDISHILDLHDQGYINYCIEKKFNVIIPVYDYRAWFKTTTDILRMIECLK